MPNIKSAFKRMRTSRENREANRSSRSGIRTLHRALFAAAAKKDKPAATELLKKYCSALDKAYKHGVIKKNTSVRSKSRASNLVRSLG